MFNRILIANRGEIAERVARSARRLGITTVAVYSDADRDALHVEACDEACHLGPAAINESYLNGARVLEVARECRVDAIHPGYGFLSENADFARSCDAAGIVFIGPPASAIEAMGSKSQAKALMESAGVALVPGYHGVEQTAERLRDESKKIGYPQLIKASAGGGGKGMRLVRGENEFDAALTSARREASAAFADESVLIERYLTQPRHVEVQIFADSHGQFVHLFERDCSIQRRHQKVLEEAPAPGMTTALRAQMTKAAIDCARAIDYVGAGTVEFLLDHDGRFYFMEMNTRLQVEHPVTEAITGLDLVEWQIRVAGGEPLPCAQDEIRQRGHAFEARIYAESPEREFMPAAGRIQYLRQPKPLEGVRIDTGVRCGDPIGIHYDPMIAKLIVHAQDRGTALAKLGRSLTGYQILGLKTNLGFLARLVAMPELGKADFDTGFILSHREQLLQGDAGDLEQALVLATAALSPLFADDDALLQSPWQQRDHWRLNLPVRQSLVLEHDGQPYQITLTRERDVWIFELNEKHYRISGFWIDGYRMRLQINRQSVEFPVLREADSIALCYRSQTYQFQIPNTEHSDHDDSIASDHPRAPMSGTIVALPAAVGDTVCSGDTLVVIEAMKMEHSLRAGRAAKVGEILYAVGDQVDEGDILVLLEV